MKDRSPKNTKYHSGFISALEMLLWKYGEKVSIEQEKALCAEPLRLDALIKKDPSVHIDSAICEIFKEHNILEYKRPDDDLNIDVYDKVMAYALLYRSYGDTVESIRYEEMSVTLYRHAYPRALFKRFAELGYTVENKYPGVYYIKGNQQFTIQILVGRELDEKEYAMFRVLVPNAREDDIRIFKDMAVENKDAKFQRFVDNIFQVSVTINWTTYEKLMKEDPAMCDALRDLMKDEFIETERKGEERGIEKGRAEGRAEGETRLGTLMQKLLSAGRTDDAMRASTDKDYRQELFRQYGIV